MKIPHLRTFLPEPALAIATIVGLLFAVPTSSFAGKIKHDHIISVNAAEKTIEVTNMSTGKPITLKIDDIKTEILIDNHKAKLEELQRNMQVSYAIGTNGSAARIVGKNPSVKSVFKH